MYFQAQKVISAEEISRIVYDTLGLINAKENALNTDIDRLIPTGKVDVFSVKDAVVMTMIMWVERIENYMRLLRKESHPTYQAMYKTLVFERGFTFQEYCQLFDGYIPENDYAHYPAHTFLGIQTDVFRRQFISGRNPERTDYCELLSNLSISIWQALLQSLTAIVPYDEMLRHCYINGKSGSGKSELLKTLFYGIQSRSQAELSASLILIDPHGDLAEELKSFALNTHKERVIYVDPYLSSGKTPIINPLELPLDADGNIIKDEDTINGISEELVKVFQELLHDTSLSNQMRAIIMPCVATLLRRGNSSLLDLQTFMDDSLNKDLVKLGKQSPNPSHRNFFATQFYNATYKRTKSSIFTKIQSLLNSHTFYNLVTGKSSINIEQAMNQGKVIIFNLSKGKMGIESSEAFGRFMIASIQTIAQRRAKMAVIDRKPCFVFIDEFHNYITDSIQIILKEARKYRVPLILANQTIEDIRGKQMLGNILNNTEVKFVGRNGSETLKKMANEIGVPLNNLQDMRKYYFYVKAGDRSAYQFRTDTFLKDASMQLTTEQLNDLDKFQLKKYYKEVVKANLPNASEQGVKHKEKEDTQNVIEGSPEAKFDL